MDAELVQILSSLEAQAEKLEKLDEIQSEQGDIKRIVNLIAANNELFQKEIVRMVEDHEKRITALESHGARLPHAPRSPSFTNEISETVGTSIRAAATMQLPILEALEKSAKQRDRQSVLSQIVTGVVIALVIVAWLLFEHK
jgi:hypothetical protein